MFLRKFGCTQFLNKKSFKIFIEKLKTKYIATKLIQIIKKTNNKTFYYQKYIV